MLLNKHLEGTARLEIHDCIESLYEKQLNLEYYLLETEAASEKYTYGIEIVKKEKIDNSVVVEAECAKNISSDKEGIQEILQKLIKFKVTPVALHDVVYDLTGVYN